MTKNVNFRFLSFKLKNANLDYFRIVVKMSETNHIKKLKKFQNVYQPFIGIENVKSHTCPNNKG